jgi:hypothetical protein
MANPSAEYGSQATPACRLFPGVIGAGGWEEIGISFFLAELTVNEKVCRVVAVTDW